MFASTATVVMAAPLAQPVSPVQPMNVDPIAAAGAVSVTIVPSSYGSLQSLPQSIPAGLDVRSPTLAPVPTCSAVNVNCWVNVAVQLSGVLIVMAPSAQSASPLQLSNTDPAAGAGGNVTMVPWA